MERQLVTVAVKKQNPQLHGPLARGLRTLTLLACSFACLAGLPFAGRCQVPAPTPNTGPASSTPAGSAAVEDSPRSPLASDSLLAWEGLPVRRISIQGIPDDRLAPLSGHLAQVEGTPLTADNLKKSLRQLYASGLYDTVEVEGSRQGDGVALVFLGAPRTFIGTVGVDGAAGATMNTQLQRSSQLEAGTRFTQAKMNRAVQQMRETLEENGYHQSAIEQTVSPHPEQQLSDIAFRVTSGPRARLGKVTLTGDSGMKLEEFRHYAHLRTGAYVDHDTVSRALDGVLKQYQSQNRLEADVRLESAQYDPAGKAMDYRFSANRGPVVKVVVEGANVDSEHIKRLIPIFQEGSVDEDLLTEGNRRLRDYYQRLGYFDAKVDHLLQSAGSNPVIIRYTVQLGLRRRVDKVSITGNRYFATATLMDLVGVHAADILDRHGLYSQALVSADISALEAVYQNNGFSQVKVTAQTSTPETAIADNSGPVATAVRPPIVAPLTVTYHVTEGQQLHVGSMQIEGNEHLPSEKLTPLLNSIPGQMLSPRNLAGDRDALVDRILQPGISIRLMLPLPSSLSPLTRPR